MAFTDFTGQQATIDLLQRSLERGRLAHAYLLSGSELDSLVAIGRTLAKTLNCEHPSRIGASGMPVDCCDQCLTCRKVEGETHPDVLWVRPESKSRVITIEQIRDLMQTVQLKPTQAKWKVAMIVAADRLNTQAANAFLKTLEEPPADSILILSSTEPDRMLETILSRCLRLNAPGETNRFADTAFLEWLSGFAEAASTPQKSLLGRYRLLSVLLNRLNHLKEAISEALTKKSPLERFDDVEPRLREQWENELTAAVEAEYRRQRAELITGVQWWLRDVWLATLQLESAPLSFPQLATATRATAQRLSPGEAQGNLELLEQLQRHLASNVQEALALEVGLLRLKM